MCEPTETARTGERIGPVMPHLQDVASLRLPSSSSDTCLLGFRDWPREFAPDPGRDDVRELCFDCALRDTVFRLSRACLRRSCIASGLGVRGMNALKLELLPVRQGESVVQHRSSTEHATGEAALPLIP